MTTIYVGNLGFDVSEQQLRTLFTSYGTVERVTVILDADFKQPRGFGFVEMSDAGQADAAMKALDGIGFHDRLIRVSVARAKIGVTGNGVN